jgi:hypothetical protein
MRNLLDRLLAAGFEPVNLKARKVQKGSNVVNLAGYFGTVKTINKSAGIYGIRYDIDFYGEPLSCFSADEFEKFFLVDRRKKV